MSDSLVRCGKCGSEQRVSLLECMRHGWPKCHCNADVFGTTMALAETDADIGATISSVMEEHGLSASPNQVGRSHG